MRLGGLYETALGDFERAGKVYREVLELDGSSIFALRGLERIYQALQDWPDMVDVLERQLDVVETERERVDVLLKLAQIQEEQFLKADIAAQRLEGPRDGNRRQLRVRFTSAWSAATGG